MKDFFNKTLGGLTRAYYIRQLFFGIVRRPCSCPLSSARYPGSFKNGRNMKTIYTAAALSMISIAGCNKSEPMTEADLNRRTPEQQEAYEKRFDMSASARPTGPTWPSACC